MYVSCQLVFVEKQLVNIYIFYEINMRPYNSRKDFVLGNSVFGAVELTTNDNPDKYKYCPV